MASKNNKKKLEYGLPPRANFLPPKVKIQKSAEMISEGTMKRWVVYVFALSFAVYLWMTVSAFAGNQAITEDKIRIIEIKASKSNYADVRTLDSTLKRMESAFEIAKYPNIRWYPILDAINRSLPSGSQMTQISIRSLASGENIGTESGLANSADAVASLEMQVQMPSLESIELWLNNLRGTPGYSAAKLKSVSLANSKYVAQVTLDLAQSAWSAQPLPEPNPSASSTPATTETPAATPTPSAGN